MRCKNCGAEVSSGTLFCPNCGQRLSKSIETIEINSGSQLFFPASSEEINDTLYLFDLSSLQIFDSNYEEIGIIKILNKYLKTIAEIYDESHDKLLFSVSSSLFSSNFNIKNSHSEELAHIKKIVFSPMIKNFYIQSPSKEKWFSIIKSRSSNYKIKSFSTNDVVAEFGNINQLEEIIIDFSFKNPREMYFLKVYDDKVDRVLLLGSFITIYLNNFG
jgi:hypothetical protein